MAFTPILRVGTTNATITANAPQFEELFRQAPKDVFFQARSLIGRWFGHTRNTIIRNAGTPGLKRAILKHGWVEFKVEPFTSARTQAQLRARIEKEKLLDLGSIVGRYELDSEAEIIQEFGGAVRARDGSMAVPVGKFARMSQKTRRARNLLSPADYSNSTEGRERPLVLIDKRRKGGRQVRVLARPTGTVRKDGKPKLEAVWVLRNEVDLRPQLNVRKSWDEDAGYRQRTLSEHLGVLVNDLGLRLQRIGRGAA